MRDFCLEIRFRPVSTPLLGSMVIHGLPLVNHRINLHASDNFVTIGDNGDNHKEKHSKFAGITTGIKPAMFELRILLGACVL